MTKPLLIATAVGSLAVGFGIGYKVAEKRLAAQFDERLERETAEMRIFYRNIKKPYSTPQEAAADLIRGEPPVEEPDEESPAERANGRVEYHKIVKTNYDPDDDPEETLAVEAEIAPPPAQDEHNLFNEKPHIIPQDWFMANDSEYVQAVLTYYKEDGALADERDDLIEDVDATVGLQNLQQFGVNSSDPNVLHIRNGRLQMEFEVCLNPSSYAKEVNGIDPEGPELPSGRQRP